MKPVVLVVAAFALHGGNASADDGYCDYVEGVASSQSAVLFAPELFAQLGYIEQSTLSAMPDPMVDTDGTRFVGGVRWRLSGIREATLTRGRAAADCTRHRAFERVRGDTLRAALEARAKVLDDAMLQAEKILAATNADFEARRATAQETTATRLRVEDLRRLSGETRAALRSLPAADAAPLSGALAEYQRADAEVEEKEAALRRWGAIDVSVRFGVDQYVSNDSVERSPFFGLVSVGVNLGILFQGSGNSRAADGRARLLKSGRDPMSLEATSSLVEAAARRAQETATLEADLKRQIDALDRVGGDDSRRYRLIVWFDWIKVRAEHAFHEAHAAALRQVVGR
ncbi:MAG: hypothetical protein H0T89_34330 [Deltaproteobacteria bacterium]|nr:hypothetical protein [Deltaproteobacteria bacterium]MDQ3297955.1 hypothetical protein [Myxococcota bacterium]